MDTPFCWGDCHGTLCPAMTEKREQCDIITEQNRLLGYTEARKRKEADDMAAIDVNVQNFQEEVLDSSKKVLLDFWAPWCGPCRKVVPIVEEIAEERPDIKVCKVNVDEQMALAGRYRVSSIPTLMVLENGKVVNQAMGARPKHAILRMLDE